MTRKADNDYLHIPPCRLLTVVEVKSVDGLRYIQVLLYTGRNIQEVLCSRSTHSDRLGIVIAPNLTLARLRMRPSHYTYLRVLHRSWLSDTD